MLAVTKRRGLGVIVVKGLLTSGRQINVQRTADKAVRDVKAIAQVYIGRLNDEGSRNALKQQISALLLQMAADGALVPSTDGTSPPFVGRRALHPGRLRQRDRPGRHRDPPGPGDRLHQRHHPRPQLTPDS